jgi:hypothetical protein
MGTCLFKTRGYIDCNVEGPGDIAANGVGRGAGRLTQPTGRVFLRAVLWIRGMIFMIATTQKTEAWRPYQGGASVGAKSDDRKHDGEVSSQLQCGLLLLLESSAYAHTLAEDAWEFSVEWPELQRLGLNCNEGRWLIHKGLVHHAREVTSVEDERRRFVPSPNLSLSERTCLVLSEGGCELARRLAESRGTDLSYAVSGPTSVHLPHSGLGNGAAAVGSQRPKWDRDRRQLRVGSNIVKEFKVPAMNQEVILAVFEEESWPPKIDDPLPRKSDIDPQRRLHDTINSLNRRQRHQLLHFSADGLAQGIRWELVAKGHPGT